MNQADYQYAQAILSQLKTMYQIDVLTGGGLGNPDPNGPEHGAWTKAELDRLFAAIALMADLMGGSEKFVQNLCGVTVRKAEIGSHGGEALAHTVSFSIKGTFSSWTVVHEFAHAWDANHGWRLSRQLEKITKGFTSPVLSWLKKAARLSDSGFRSPEQKPGRYGRRPGCNRAGYFYGDRPSGSNWSFNRVEDFAESVAMYVGWERRNDLSQHARNRIVRYRLPDLEKDPFGVSDNWTYYSKHFYPENGDYAKTKRWQFVDDLVNGRIEIS